MAATIDTQYGAVTTSLAYFSECLRSSVIIQSLYPTGDPAPIPTRIVAVQSTPVVKLNGIER